ncbi:7TM diverse intracellular signaling domain-containing protein [Spirosoma aerolatum]|uniref:7TM diverse intracellular signaling domain-containing protein n=1 Tax=Spirosoma aerolatum TaxID=1211326 RepID=UPI0009AE0A2C|nr:7TM diverse intracellular signaling domain-containing protein [Spirosoma aerolatum]
MKRLLLTLVLCLFGLATHAQMLVLNDSLKTYYLQDFAEAVELAPGQATIDSLLKHPQKYAFVPVKQQMPTWEKGKVCWLRLRVTNELNADLFLHFPIFNNPQVLVYTVSNNRVVGSQTFRGIIARPSDSYYNIRRVCLLRIPMAQTHTVYISLGESGYSAFHATLQSSLALTKELQWQDLIAGLFCGFVLMVIIYSLLLYLRLGDKANLIYMLWVLLVAWNGLSFYNHMATYWPWLHNTGGHYALVWAYANTLVHQLFAISFLSLQQRSPALYRLSLLVIAFDIVAMGLFLTDNAPDIFLNLFLVTDSLYCLVVGIISYRKGFKPALYFVLGNLAFYVFMLFTVLMVVAIYPMNFWTYSSSYFGLIVEILFFTFGLSYKVNLLKKHQDEAIQEQLRLTQENQQLVETQNRVLEEKVEQRTAELQESLTTLKATQAQLIQKEKLASLGELTASIAHEIQNPLNFVNNFSEVSAELVDELEEEADAGHTEEVKAIAGDLRQNLQKVAHHGRRASAIVKGMLEHSRASTGEKQPTDLNVLADEYLRLAYQGLRAKDQRFSCELKTDLAADLPTVSVVPQDIGRVLLNLYNNAFYAVRQKQQTAPSDYQPTVWVSTRQEPGRVVICVRDNGTGIPDAVKEKIFQPFFTTKPTGEGTGLGLSLSYDIVTKGHGGTMTVESQEGEGTQFIITLPV